jgi:hypothetical protein
MELRTLSQLFLKLQRHFSFELESWSYWVTSFPCEFNRRVYHLRMNTRLLFKHSEWKWMRFHRSTVILFSRMNAAHFRQSTHFCKEASSPGDKESGEVSSGCLFGRRHRMKLNSSSLRHGTGCSLKNPHIAWQQIWYLYGSRNFTIVHMYTHAQYVLFFKLPVRATHPAHVYLTHQAGSRGNVSDTTSGGAWLESRPGDRLFRPTYFVVFLSPSI